MLKHKDNELRTLSSNYDRTREDFTYRLQESLDRLHDRLTMEKHHDIQGINERNEVLIKQLVDFQSQELRSLREQLLQTERSLRDKEFII
jgi:hypothetical protein